MSFVYINIYICIGQFHSSGAATTVAQKKKKQNNKKQQTFGWQTHLHRLNKSLRKT